MESEAWGKLPSKLTIPLETSTLISLRFYSTYGKITVEHGFKEKMKLKHYLAEADKNHK